MFVACTGNTEGDWRIGKTIERQNGLATASLGRRTETVAIYSNIT